MKEFKGTEWVAFNDRVEDWSGNMHTKICDVTTGRDKTKNQKLIAAAPELLEALQDLVGHFCAYTPSEIESLNSAKQVINKAVS